jgi:hypothetical protein
MIVLVVFLVFLSLLIFVLFPFYILNGFVSSVS